MIEVVEGMGVGAGKSYYVVTRLIQHFAIGGTAYVVDTFELVWDKFKAYVWDTIGVRLEDDQYRPVSEDAVPTLHEHTAAGTEECPVLIVVDECHGKLNARDWNDRSKRSLFDWATQSRHDDNDLIFISQSAANIDKQLRRIATYTWRIRNTEKMGHDNILGALLKLQAFLTFGLAGGPSFIVGQYDQDGRTPLGKKQIIKQDKRIFAIYRSKSMRGRHRRLADVVARKQLERRKGRSPRMKSAILGIGVITAIIIGCFFTMWRTKSKHDAIVRGRETASHPLTLNPAASGTPQPAASPLYELRHEAWTRRLGSSYLRLTSGDYRVGRMSNSGLVEAINDGVVRVRKPDGGLLYIVSEDSAPDPNKSAPVATPRPSPSIVVAEDHGLFGPDHTLHLTGSASPSPGVLINH